MYFLPFRSDFTFEDISQPPSIYPGSILHLFAPFSCFYSASIRAFHLFFMCMNTQRMPSIITK